MLSKQKKCFHFESSLKSFFLYREMMNLIKTNENLYHAEMRFGVPSMTTAVVGATEGFLPLCNSLVKGKKICSNDGEDEGNEIKE
ncbi:hypothetical protein GQ457_09G013610 [Hibiscus cannabinus]